MTPAEQIRRTWLAEMGTNEEDIEASIRDIPPIVEADEQEQLDYLRKIRGTNE